MTSKAEYALLWANGASFGEIYDLMAEEIRREYVTVIPAEVFDSEPHPVGKGMFDFDRPLDFEPGATAYYDDVKVEIVERLSSTRPGSDDYRVRTAAGSTFIVWGSDLVRA